VGALSQLLSLYPVRTALDVRCRFGDPWVLDHAGAALGVAPYHLIVRGRGRLEVGGRKDIPLEAGDIILFPKGSPHRLSSEQAGDAPLAPVHETDGGPLRLVFNEGGGPETGILCGQFEFGDAAANGLLAGLPELVHIRSGERQDLAMLHRLVEMLRLETDTVRPGGRAVISQLASALFALVMRAWVEQSAAMPSLFALLAEPRLQRRLQALQGMLAAPERPWQLAELAEACNMSRANFARVFQKAANATPAEVLTQTRMARAAVLLGEARLAVGQIAEQVGYQSEAAFNRVFKRHYGVGPGAYRRGQRLPDGGQAPGEG
jgi:AraC family transcriptional activator of mtrCDE